MKQTGHLNPDLELDRSAVIVFHLFLVLPLLLLYELVVIMVVISENKQKNIITAVVFTGFFPELKCSEYKF